MDTLSPKQKGATFSIYIAILAVYFMIPDMGYISPSLAGIAAEYGVDTGTASYLATIVSATQVVAALVCGVIVGKYIKHKTLLSIAVGGMAVFGMLPGLFTGDMPFWVLMVDRAVFGLFLGFLQPIIFAYIAQVFVDENKRATAYGMGNVAFNVGAVFATSVGGICVGIGWNAAFWLYGVGLIALVCVLLFYKEPEKLGIEVKAEEKPSGPKPKITGIAWFYMAVFVVAMILDYPIFTAFIPCLIEHGITDGVMGGQLLTLFTAIGIIASAIFGVMFRVVKTTILPLACLVAGIGMVLIYVGLDVTTSFAFCVLAICVLGFGHTTITVGVPQCVSVACSPAVASAALAFTAVSMNVGTFISSPYIQLVTSVAGTSDYTIVFLVSGVLMALFSVVVFLVGRKALKSAAQSEVEG